jgi:hypothetical protein
MIVLGRYELFDVLASGGMASVHLGRLRGDDQFARVVAIKRLHPQFSRDPEFAGMLRDEARLASRIRHPNVVPVVDIIAEGGELSLVMEYVPGESLARLVGSGVPPSIACSIMLGVLSGLHAAHEACDESGHALDLVHRDVSPHNVLVGTDGLAHVIDFGIAKARGRSSMTREGDLKGKLAYMAPEQIRRAPVTRAVDIYAASATLWELLVGRRLFDADDEAGLIVQLLTGASEPPSGLAAGLSPEVDAVIMRGLAREPTRRYPTARAMAEALEKVLAPAPHAEVARWLDVTAHDALVARALAMAAAERGPRDLAARSAAPHESTAIIPLESGEMTAIMATDPLRAPGSVRTAESRAPASRGAARSVRWNRVVLAALGLVLVLLGLGRVFAYPRPKAPIDVPASPPPETRAPPPEIASSVIADPPPSSSVVAGPRPNAPVSPPLRARPRPVHAADCDPPYTLEHGHKVFKRACL